MPDLDFKLPSGEVVTLIYGAKWPDLETQYFQGIRSESLDESHSAALYYHRMKKIWAYRLGSELYNHIKTEDVLISPPSSSNDTDVYRDAIRAKISSASDAGTFTRHGNTKASAASTIEEMIGEFACSPAGNEDDFRSIVILDESVASGKTISATLFHLRKAGLPKDCRIIFVTWALFREGTPNIFDDGHPQSQ